MLCHNTKRTHLRDMNDFIYNVKLIKPSVDSHIENIENIEGGIVRKILNFHVCRRCGQPSGTLGGRRGRVWLEEPLLCGISQVKGLSYVQ